MFENKIRRLKDLFTPIPVQFQRWLLDKTKRYHFIIVIAHLVSVLLLTLFDLISKKISYQYPFRLAYVAIDVFLLCAFRTRLVKNIDMLLLFCLSLVIILSRVNDVVGFNRNQTDSMDMLDVIDVPSYIIVHAATTLPHYRQWFYCFGVPLVFVIAFPISRLFFNTNKSFQELGSDVIYIRMLIVCYGAIMAHYIKFELMVRTYIADHSLETTVNSKFEFSDKTSIEASNTVEDNTIKHGPPILEQSEQLPELPVSEQSLKKASEGNFNMGDPLAVNKSEGEVERRQSEHSLGAGPKASNFKAKIKAAKQVSKQALLSKFNDPNWENKCKFIDFRDTLRVLRRSLPLHLFAVLLGTILKLELGASHLANLILVIGMQGGAFFVFTIIVFSIIKTYKIQFPRKTEKDNISAMPIDLNIYKKNNVLELLIFVVSCIAINCYMIAFNAASNQHEVFATYIDAASTLRMRRMTLVVFTFGMLMEGIVLYFVFRAMNSGYSDAYMEIIKAIAYGSCEGLVLGYYLVYLRRKLFEKNAQIDLHSSQQSSKTSAV